MHSSNSTESVNRVVSKGSGNVKPGSTNNPSYLGQDHPNRHRRPMNDPRFPTPAQVKRNWCVVATVSSCVIFVLVAGVVFGTIFPLIYARDALVDQPPPTISSTTTSGARTPSVFTTLVPSEFTTLLPSEITIFVPSDASTLIPSVITALQRDGYSPTKQVGSIFTAPVGLSSQVTSTVAVVLPTTTTVTVSVSVYNSTFGGYVHHNEHSDNGVSQHACGNEGQDACMSTTGITQLQYPTSAASGDLRDLNFTTASIVVTPAGSVTAMEAINILPNPTSSSDEIGTSYSMLCDVADMATLAPCNPIQTGWYISPSPPQVASFLHPIFRFLANIPSRIICFDVCYTQRLSSIKAWAQRGKLLISLGAGNVAAYIPASASLHQLRMEIFDRGIHLAKSVGLTSPTRPLGGDRGPVHLRPNCLLCW